MRAARIAAGLTQVQACALNEAFQELDSARDGLTVLAVLVAEEGRWA